MRRGQSLSHVLFPVISSHGVGLEITGNNTCYFQPVSASSKVVHPRMQLSPSADMLVPLENTFMNGHFKNLNLKIKGRGGGEIRLREHCKHM